MERLLSTLHKYKAQMRVVIKLCKAEQVMLKKIQGLSNRSLYLQTSSLGKRFNDPHCTNAGLHVSVGPPASTCMSQSVQWGTAEGAMPISMLMQGPDGITNMS